ncbi:MAG: hypothetical protein IKE60_29325 [Reyranella sp.]|uniref:hypothetical protein n=1 Tax=Reyranella sp. TaxID=1929291 RepID=UPI0025D5580B|nr:hypothetical protein [Reyranella sp.]MBR2818805.1 hypothetical protein [Reyranella sp.]
MTYIKSLTAFAALLRLATGRAVFFYQMGIPMAKAKPTPKAPKLEFEPDAWARFESLVKSAAAMGHRPHLVEKEAKKPPKTRVSKPKRSPAR